MQWHTHEAIYLYVTMEVMIWINSGNTWGQPESWLAPDVSDNHAHIHGSWLGFSQRKGDDLTNRLIVIQQADLPPHLWEFKLHYIVASHNSLQSHKSLLDGTSLTPWWWALSPAPQLFLFVHPLNKTLLELTKTALFLVQIDNPALVHKSQKHSTTLRC